EKSVLQRFAAAARCAEGDFQLLAQLRLTNVLGERRRAKAEIQLFVFGRDYAGRDESFTHGKKEATRSPQIGGDESGRDARAPRLLISSRSASARTPSVENPRRS